MSARATLIVLTLTVSLAALGCGADSDNSCGYGWLEQGLDPFADEVVDFAPAPGAVFGADAMPDVVLGPPEGAGEGQGSLDVASLGCGGSITLRFDAPAIVDGPGVDFIVFENAFNFGSASFAEPAQVSVSADGETWVAFPCDPPTLEGCAGAGVVYSSPEICVDPTDPAVAGGDAFDLADVGLTEAAFVRLEDRSLERPGADAWCDVESAGFDLDAIAALPR